MTPNNASAAAVVSRPAMRRLLSIFFFVVVVVVVLFGSNTWAKCLFLFLRSFLCCGCVLDERSVLLTKHR